MSIVGGAFDETTLRTLRVKADEIMFDDRIKQQFIPQIGVVEGVRAAQTALVNPKFQQIKDSKGQIKQYDVEVMWENACDITAEDNVACTFGGTKLSTNAQSYSLGYEKVVNFTVNEADYIDNEFDVESSIAKGFLKADKELSEAFAQYCVSQINAFKGVNAMGTAGKGVVSGSDTFIEAAYWDAKLVAYFIRAGILNRFSSPTFISGANLFEDMFVVNESSGNADGKGDDALYKNMKIFFDLFNIDSVNDPQLITYMISLGAIALATRHFNPATPEKLHTFTRYSQQSRFIPELTYDIFYESACDSDLVEHKFKIKLKADLFNNPEGCAANNTGVLTFICGSPA